MYLLRKRSIRRPLVGFLIALMAVFSYACQYYKAKSVPRGMYQSYFVGDIQKQFVIELGGQYFGITEVQFADNTLSGRLVYLERKMEAYLNSIHFQETGRIPNDAPDTKLVFQLAHVVLAPTSPLVNQANHEEIDIGQPISIPVTEIDRLDIIDLDSGRTVASFVAIAIGVTGLVFGLVLAGAASSLSGNSGKRGGGGSASSCPFVYAFDGEGYQLEGEVFGGAIFKNLERTDYLKLPSLKEINDTYRIRISNELREKQYLNQVNLMVVEHDPEVEVLMDRTGGIHSINNPQPLIRATTRHGREIAHLLKDKDNQNHHFGEGTDAVQTVDLSFVRDPSADTAKLILNAQSSYWVDYLWGAFAKKQGSFYPLFVQQHNRMSRQRLEKWMVEQDLFLTVYLETDGGWQLVDRIRHTGPLKDRDLVIPIDLKNSEKDEVSIRLRTGFAFWQLDYAAIDFTGNPSTLTCHLEPAHAIDSKMQTDFSAELASDDARYYRQLETGTQVEVRYPAMTPAPGVERSFFLLAKGYYEHVRDYSGWPEFDELRHFNRPGHFARFSKEEYGRFLEALKMPKDGSITD